MIRTYSKSAPAGDSPDETRIALRHIVTGEAMLDLGVIPSANSWEETTDDGAITLTLRVDDDPAAT